MVTIINAAPFVSIIVPCRNEAEYIAECLQSIRRTAYPADRLEILVADGCSDDRTRAIATEVAAGDPRIRVLENRGRTAPSALNLGIRESRGSVIVRMDAHATYPPEYIPRLVAALEVTGADNVGGVLVTLPANTSATARAIAVAMSHRLGVGNSYFRIGAPARRWVDTVPFGCFRREVFDRVGGFDEELVRNQDDELNFRILRHGGRVLLEPAARASYYARRTLSQLGRMFYQYGYFKPLVARKIGRIMTLRQLVPAAFLLALGTGSAVAFVWAPAGWAVAVLAAAYGALVLGAGLVQVRRLGWRGAAVLCAAIPLLHVAYGIGFLKGIMDHLLRLRSPGRRLTAPSLSR